MDSLLTLVLFGGAIVVYLIRSDKSRVARQKRAAEATYKQVVSKPLNKTKVKTKSSSARAPSKVKKTARKTTSKRPDYVPTYEGPMFAQPGEKSHLFSYGSFTEKYLIEAPYSIIDFETSGFHPSSARILEVAIIKIDSNGNVLDEFSTLINPEDGDVGRTDIHQITIGMVKNAPKLSEVVGHLLSILDSSIVVAHNARFEENFLESAFREVGIKHPLMPTIDTLWLARQVLKLPNYKLATVIDEFGFNFQDAHTALGDVRAMAKALPEMLEIGKTIKFPSQLIKSPSFSKAGKVLPRKSNA